MFKAIAPSTLFQVFWKMYARAHELVGEAVPDPFLTYPPFFRFFKIYFDKINIAE